MKRSATPQPASRTAAVSGVLFLGAGLCALALCCSAAHAPGAETSRETRGRLDPAAWGGDHVGKPMPDFVTGDECLFCHRNDVGPAWSENRHQLTIRRAATQPSLVELLKASEELAPFAAEAQLLLGHDRRVRFLKRSDEYGKLALLSVQCDPGGENADDAAHAGSKIARPRERGRGTRQPALINADDPHWDSQTFGQRCAGCHATGVSAKTHAFSLLSIDCYACHGDVDLEHTNDQSLILLSKERDDPARVVTSVCASCHVRSGKSASSGLPYPNNFVPGDNLFRDFQVDFSDEHLASLNPADRHVLENVRDVVVFGEQKITCLTCHEVHKQSSRRHRFVGSRAICLNCHEATGPKSKIKHYHVHSELCGY